MRKPAWGQFTPSARIGAAHLGAQEWLGADEALRIAVARDVARPVVRQKHVERFLKLLQAVHFQLADVVCAAHTVHLVWRPLVVPLQQQFSVRFLTHIAHGSQL